MKNVSRKISYMLLAGTILLLCVFFVVILAGDQPAFAGKEPARVSFAGAYSADGGAWNPLGAGDEPVEDGRRTLAIRGHFGQDIPEGETLWFRAENVGITLDVGGRRAFACNQPGSFPKLFQAPGYAWYSMESPGITADDEISLEILAYYGNSRQTVSAVLDSLYVGDEGGLYRLLFGQFDLLALALALAMLAGLIYLLEGAIDAALGMPEAGRIALLGFYCFTGGLWCITDVFYPYFSLVLSPPWLASVIDMSGVVLFPLALMFLVRFFMRGRLASKVMDTMVLISVSAVLLSLILQLGGIADLYQQQAWLGVAALILLSMSLLCLWSDLRQFNDTYLWILLFAIIPVVISIALDSVNVLYPFMPRRTVMRYFFALSATLMISQLVSYAKQETKSRQRMQHMKEELLESRISIMLSQIQPHFLFNTLSSISYLCKTDPKLAGEIVNEFSRFLRGNIDSLSTAKPIPFSCELEHLNHYLAIEKLRFSDMLEVELDIKTTAFMLPSLTLQPIVENAIRHGIGKKENGGTVTIQTRETESEIIITVIDDGVGFDTSGAQSGGRSHIGIENVRTRLAMQCGGTLQIESEQGMGAAVTITIPKGESEM